MDIQGRNTQVTDMEQEKKIVTVRSSKKIYEALGTDDGDVRFHRLQEISALLWLPDSLDDAQRVAKIQSALEDLAAIEPRDPLERMLSLQMIGCDEAIKDCFRRALPEGQTFEGRNAALSNAHKLMTTFAKLLDTLNKHRGKGQQKMTIEHVNVHAGGQAVVGNVEAGVLPAADRSSGPELEAIPHEPEIPMESPKSKKPKSRTRNRKKSGGT